MADRANSAFRVGKFVTETVIFTLKLTATMPALLANGYSGCHARRMGGGHRAFLLWCFAGGGSKWIRRRTAGFERCVVRDERRRGRSGWQRRASTRGGACWRSEQAGERAGFHPEAIFSGGCSQEGNGPHRYDGGVPSQFTHCGARLGLHASPGRNCI